MTISVFEKVIKRKTEINIFKFTFTSTVTEIIQRNTCKCKDVQESKDADKKPAGMCMENHKGQAIVGGAGHGKGLRMCLMRAMYQPCVIHGLFVF